MPSVIVIADDLTGAADTGVTFVRQGATAAVVWQADVIPDADVVVVSTESRHLPQAEAERRVRAVAAALGLANDAETRWIYKKIDSTLRGHPGPELAVLLDVAGVRTALVAPALPAQGRLTIGGVHYVQGAPLAETVFGAEVASSEVCVCLAAGLAEGRLEVLPLDATAQAEPPAGTGPHAAARALVGDARSDAELRKLAQRAFADGTRVLCGSAGLAQALAALLAEAGAWRGRGVADRASADRAGLAGWRSPADRGKPAGAGVLVVAASRHPATVRQIAAAEAAGIPVIRPSLGWFLNDEGAADVRAALVRGLDAGAVVLTTAGLPDMPGSSAALAARLAGAVADTVAQRALCGLVLTGGDAAIAVSRALAAEALWLGGEVATGVPWGWLRGGTVEGVPVVTKAGGFGDDQTLVAAIRFLREGGGCRVIPPQ